MQTSKKNTDNSEKRSRYMETFNSLRSHFTTSKFKIIILVCLISFTSLLVRQTLQIQHSCNPMIHWSGEFPTECQVAVKNDFDSFDKFSYPRQQELKTLKQQSRTAQKTEEHEPYINLELPTQPSSEARVDSNSDLVGVAKGAAAGIGVAAVAIGVFSVTPPGAVLLGLGVAIGVWKAIKSVF